LLPLRWLIVSNKEANQPPNTEPRFSYGHIVVGVAFLIMAASWGLYSIFGVSLNPLLTDFGWTRATTSGAFSLSLLLSGAVGIAMGELTDRFGPRLVVAICGIFLGLGYLLMSQTSTLWQLYLFYGVMIGTGVSGIWVPLLSSIARWFTRRRSLISGIVVSGAGIGGLVAPLVIIRLIAAYGWRVSYFIQGVVILIVMILGAQLLRRAPEPTGQLPHGENEGKQQGLTSDTGSFSLREAMHTAQFWLLCFMFFCYGYCIFSIMIHIVPHIIELEISAIGAANIMAATGGVTVLGNFVLGGIGDRIGSRQIFIIGFILMSAVMLWLTLATEVWMLYLFAVVFGLALGGMATSESPLVARLFGLRSHGLIFGVACLSHVIGGSIGPVVTGYIFDLTFSYQIAFLICAALGVTGLILTVVMRPTKRLGLRL
jgi:MFS family permease